MAKLDWITQGMSEEYALYIEMGTPVFIERYADRLSDEDGETLRGAYGSGWRFGRRKRLWFTATTVWTT